MAEEDDASKTEDPTAKRLQKSREKGQVAISQEVKSWIILLAGAAAVMTIAPWTMRRVADRAVSFVDAPHTIAFDPMNMRRVLADLLAGLGVDLAPILILLMIAALAGGIMQVGLLWAPEKIKPDLGRLSLSKGVGRMASLRSVMELVKGLVKLGTVSLVAMALAAPLLMDVQLLPSIAAEHSLDRIYQIVLRLGGGTVAVMTVIAGLDYLFQRHTHTKQMRMTKNEVKDEHKQSEGDPMVKARIRRLRVERAQRRMMAAIPEADVVITNPTHYAVALSYDMDEMAAPRLVAKGIDHIAQRIREVADEHEVPVVENPPLARALHAAVELDQEIPPEHYHAVAEVIGYVMRLKGERATA